MHFAYVGACFCIAAAACTSAAVSQSTLPPVPVCGFVRVDKVLDVGAMRHSSDDAVATLRLSSTAKVVRVEAIEAALPLAAKVRLPTGPRRLWLVYTVEEDPVVSVGATSSTAPESRLLRVVDDETLRPAGAVACPE